MFWLLAHAGETHETAIETVSHGVLTSWYIIIPLFFFALFGVAAAVYLASRKSHAITYNTVLAILFITGVTTYTISAPLSVICLALGFAMALFQVLIGVKKL
jgi:uncharacterized membrane protein YoaK (UPF0700 family)